MGFIGIVQVEDGKDRSGVGMLVREDGSVDVNAKTNNASNVVVARATAGTTSGVLLSASSSKSRLIKNLGASTVYLGFGVPATANEGFPVGPGETLVLPAGVNFAGDINVIGTNGNESVAAIDCL